MRRLVIGALLAAARAATAQDGGFAPSERPQVFLERSYFAPVSPTGRNLLFEGYAASHYFFVNGLADPVWQAKGGWTLTVPISMVFTVRMTNDFSSPVRTPSYQIRPLFVQSFRLWRNADRTSFWLLNASTGLTHYSNGQAGCTYQGYVVNAAGDDCVIHDPVTTERVANTRDGSFSTDFIPFVVNLRRGQLTGARDLLRRQWTIGAELQVHPLGGMPGALDGLQASTYGQHQATLRAEHELRVGDLRSRWMGVWRLGGEYTKRFGGNAANPPTFSAVETSYIFDKAGSFGGFVRFNGGRDYYNIHFQEPARFLVFGVKWDPGRLDLLNTR